MIGGLIGDTKIPVQELETKCRGDIYTRADIIARLYGTCTTGISVILKVSWYRAELYRNNGKHNYIQSWPYLMLKIGRLVGRVLLQHWRDVKKWSLRVWHMHSMHPAETGEQDF